MKREIWLDYLRVTACFLVMIVHGTEPFYLGGDGAQILTATDAFWVALAEAVARCCVPIFLLASSYLQFPLHYSTGEFLRRRAVRILIPMAVWTLVYALVWGEPVKNLQRTQHLPGYLASHYIFPFGQAACRRRRSAYPGCRRTYRPGSVPSLGRGLLESVRHFLLHKRLHRIFALGPVYQAFHS